MSNSNQSKAEEHGSEIDPIRVEVLSTEMPVHQLAKRGGERIRILKRRRGGPVELQWNVDYSVAVGSPGQLAYRLDTWVIKRRLTKLRRPIPRLIEIGDLRQIARELNHGGDTNAVRRAFDQNAATFIRAKATYKTVDDDEATLEGYFSRYNVFYRGGSLPGGRRAETVYISLNDPYYGLINDGKVRPLDFEYQRSLTPGSQRLYEIISPKIFAALKNRRNTAWIRYSTYCQLSAQKPQLSRSRMQAQMAALHRPHRTSGYIAEVRYRRSPNVDGSLDWIIEYTPGERAKVEYERFNLAKTARRITTPRSVPQPASRSPAQRASDSPSDQAEHLALRFIMRRQGHRPNALTPRQAVWGQQLLDAADGDVELAEAAIDLAVKASRDNRNGFPAHLSGVLDAGYVDQARTDRDEQRARREKQGRLKEEEERRRQFAKWCNKRAADRISQLSDAERQSLIDERLDDAAEKNRFLLRMRSWPVDKEKAWIEKQVLHDYGHEDQPTYEEWRRQVQRMPLH